MITEKKLQTIIYILLSIILSWVVFSDKILDFLHPKMIIFQIFALGLLYILSIYNIYILIKKKEHKEQFKWMTFLPFLLIFLFILVNPSELSPEAKQNKVLNLSSIENTEYLENESEKAMKDDFLGIISGMYENPDLYTGNEVSLSGFVYRDDTLNEGGIILSRMMITCCLADASVVGIYLEPENDELYENNEWIKVTGTVVEGKKYFKDSEFYEEIYTLENMNIEKIEEPEKKYVYFNF